MKNSRVDDEKDRSPRDFLPHFHFHWSVKGLEDRSCRLLLLIALALAGAPLSAANLVVQDQFGNPVADAVLSVPTTAAFSASQTIAVMDQIDRAFEPHVLLINKGQRVVFPNSDDIRHHVYSFSKTQPFELKLLRGGESKTVQFESPGVVVLGCNIHDQMVGYIYVNDNALAVKTDVTGQAQLALDGDYFLLWHPRLSATHNQKLRVPVDLQGFASAQTVTVELLPEKHKKSSKLKFKKR